MANVASQLTDAEVSSGESDVSQHATAAILRIYRSVIDSGSSLIPVGELTYPLLCGSSLGNYLDKLKAGSLRDLVV